MASRKKQVKNQENLFKALYHIPQTFYVPYSTNTQYSSRDYEVINYPVIRMAWLQRQAFLLAMRPKLNGNPESLEYQVVNDFFTNHDDEITKLIAYLHEAVLWGIAVVEVIYSKETLFPERFIPIPRYMVVIREDGFYVGDIPVDGIKYYYAQNTPTADQPFGFALINILKPLYAMAKKVWEYWGNYVRTFAMPTIIFELDTQQLAGLTDEERNRIMAELEKLKNIDGYGTLIITKELLDWQTIEPTRTGAESFQALLENIHKQIIMVILGQELTTRAQTSSYALGKVHYEVLRHIILRDSKIISDVFNNQLIPAILELRGIEPQNYPYITFEFPRELTVDDIMKLAQIGIPFSPSDVQRLLGIDLGFKEESNE